MEGDRELQSARERLDRAAAVAAAANNDLAEAAKAYSAARQVALGIGVWTDQELVDAGARRVPSPRIAVGSTKGALS